jgi:hypothetical protein|nr:MAG TPA: hypothetical protein [Caudoviricetes sp.]
MKNNKTSKEDKKKEAIEARNNINKIVDDMFENATPEQLSELLYTMVEIENEEREEIFEKTGITPLEQVDNEMRRKIYWAEKCQKIEEKKKAIEEKEKEERMIRDLLHPDTEPEGASSSELDSDDNNNNNNDSKDNGSSNNWKWIALFAIFVLGIGGCFSGLIMKGSKDAAESSYGTSNQEQTENQIEVTTSQPKEDGDTHPEEPTPFWMIELVANTPASKTITPEEAIAMGDENNWYDKGKEYLRIGKSVYKLSSKGVRGEKLPLDIKIIQTYTDFEDFFTDPERWYTEDLPGFAERYAKYVKALKEFDNGWVPDDQGDVYKEKGFSMRDTTYEDADLIYRFLLLKVAQIRQVFKIHKEILLPLASQEVRANVNVNNKMYNSVEDYLDNKVKYKDTWWNRQNSNYKLESFESDEMYKYVNELIKRYR